MVDLEALVKDLQQAGFPASLFISNGYPVENRIDCGCFSVWADGDFEQNEFFMSKKDIPAVVIIDRHLTEAGR